MKRIVLSLALLVCTLGAFAAETVLIDGLYYSLGSTTASVISDQTSDKSVYSAYTSVTIPASVTYNAYTYPVTSLGTSAFEAMTNLQSVVLPSSITTIGTDAFYGCTKLGSINLPEGLTSINQRAFYNCNLTKVTIPNTVTSIGNGAFKSNPIAEVTWLPTTCSIGTGDDAPFYSTSSKVTKFTFGDKVETIPSYLCRNMSLLETVVLPSSVKSLGQYAFMNCTSLKSINLPVTQKTLPVSFFEGCIALESIQLPATLTTISQDAFYGCTSLKDVTLHEGLTTINQRAFYNCKLTKVTIPSTVTSIGSGAFKSNPITEVTWLPPTCSIGTDSDAPFYSTSSQITKFTFGDQVEKIPGYLCQNMNKLENIVLPANLTSIGQYAFKSCSLLANIDIPATVTSIGQCAFMYCTALKNFTFPEGITTLATSVLEGSTALEKVIISASVATINQDAFYNCSALNAIYNYAVTPQTIPARALNNVNKETCILYVPIDFIDLYKAKDVWKQFYNIIGVATGVNFEEQIVNLTYLKQDGETYYMETQKWEVPIAPYIGGFKFLRWDVKAGNLADGIILQAVYESDTPTSAPAIYTNPANKAQKLIRQGNVYILSDDKMYTIQGQIVK